MTRMPGAIEHAIHHARYALDTLAADVRLSGSQPRQRTLTAHIRDAMDAIDWVTAYDAAECDHNEVDIA
jgi:hypothetical protein